MHSECVRDDEGARDLEAIAPLGDGRSGVRRDAPVRARKRRKRVSLGACVALAFGIGLSTGVVVGRRGTETRRSVRAPLTTSAPTRPTAESSATLPPQRPSPLRTLFTHVSPTGAVVIARTGLVSTAEAHGCPVATAPPFGALPGCPSSYVEGVQFDFSASTEPSYRLTVLASDSSGNPALLQPVATETAIHVIRADGSTTVAENPNLLIAAFRVRAPVSVVRVTLSDGTPETVTPTDGWAGVVTVVRAAQFPFRVGVDGLDDRGRVVATTQVQRCC